MRNLLRVFLLPAAVALGGGQAWAQAYPSKAIEIVVPWAAGGGTDLSARLFAKVLQEKWRVPIRVINQPGGNAVPGTDSVMRAPPDGYKLLWDNNSTTSIMNVAVPQLPFNVLDRTFITMVAEGAVTIATGKDSPFKTVQDLIAALKSKPEDITWTSFGGSSAADITFRRFAKAVGIDVTRARAVNVKGGGEAAVQIAGGHIMVGMGSYASFGTFINNGLIRVLVVSASRRDPQLPDVPTTRELGFDADVIQWMGVSGPPGVPQEVVTKWTEGLREAAQDPEVVQGLLRLGFQVKLTEGPAMKDFILKEMKVFEELFEKKK